ncbi:hypothetical protein CYLTODRAFT_493988 [Cylindrobasidium torrendii FP15055 ss-10]|uniref:Wings apart-like protein C-terminal domain-containing protein n=1 Tax=Cylindrobasidium torrendii FP15055 ss-10 TaxID=1314674 RepID=A0A0D7B1F5_9AGAR|nr:hypothetical protein CYLTODRAFT_493988 [Cylindrobasidium torrendii FP15055 ss-10]
MAPVRTYGKPKSRPSLKRKSPDGGPNDDDETHKKPRSTSTSGPSTTPHDVSQLLDDIPDPVAPAPSPGKITKRMLGRSKTDTSIENTPGPSTPTRRTSTLPAVLTPTPPRPALSRTASQTALNKRPSLTGTTTKRTYAGKTRSFLVELPVESLSADGEQPESYTSLRQRWGIDMSEDDPYQVSSPTRSEGSNDESSTGSPPRRAAKVKPTRPPMNPLKSMAELRHKGETRRFMDEVGYLLEGINADAGVGLRRTSALEISKQLCDAEFFRRAKAADFISQTYDAFVECCIGNGKDILLEVVFAFFCCTVSPDSSSLGDIARRTSQPSTSQSAPSQLAHTLFTILQSMSPTTDPLLATTSDATLRKKGLKKNDQVILKSIRSTVLKCMDTLAVSTATLLTGTLCSLPQELLYTDDIPNLLSALQTYLPSSDVQTTLNLLRLLDTSLLGQWTAGTEGARESLEEARDEWLLDGLLQCAMRCERQEKDEGAQSCLDMVLRVLVSLTHRDLEWCQGVLAHEAGMLWMMQMVGKVDRKRSGKGKSRVNGNVRSLVNGNGKAKARKNVKVEDVSTEDDGAGTPSPPSPSKRKTQLKMESELSTEEDAGSGAARLLDRLCLQLGLLTNLVQEDADAKDALRDILLDVSCEDCRGRCVCAEPTSALNVLVKVYLHQQVDLGVRPERNGKAMLNESEASFLLGHLAVLFGLLMQGSEENTDAILSGLENAQGGARRSRQKMLDGLVDNAEELAAFYDIIAKGKEDSEDADDGEREGRVAEGVARDVIAFLRGL